MVCFFKLQKQQTTLMAKNILWGLTMYYIFLKNKKKIKKKNSLWNLNSA